MFNLFLLRNKSGFEFLGKLFFVHVLVVIALSTVVRLYLASVYPGFAWVSVSYSLASGLLFDLVVAIYSFIPLLVVILAVPNWFLSGKSLSRLLNGLLFYNLSFFLLNLVCEFIFFYEFRDRFNFIAVDYLVYTNEVFRNIWESYPVIWFFGFVFFISGVLVFLVRRVLSWSKQIYLSVWARSFIGFIFASVVVSVFTIVSEERVLRLTNPFEEIVGRNGLHALFTAYRFNEIQFDRFYTTMSSKQASELVHEKLEGSFEAKEDFANEDEDSIVRNITSRGSPKRFNVVVVVMESLSARFLKYYGSRDGITPNLDRLIRDSIFFDQIYATGTRTVRGLEALLLSIPPTPGNSILRRPTGSNIFNLGQVFQNQGYQANFIYGGRAVFDNMREFFEGNHYNVFDQTTFPNDEIEFSNAWGVCDGDIFRQTIQISDNFHAKHIPFFNVVLTTSNHRPYTFPEGHIPKRPGMGRLSAIQYSDYAIGEFLNVARTKSWFSSTVFVFVADHNASVSGGTHILPQDYLVPMMIFAPDEFKSQIIHKLGSQIDLAPTLLSLLNFSYQSRFFGMDLIHEDPKRAFLSTYQKIAYMDNNALTVLSPIRQVGQVKRKPGAKGDFNQIKLDSVSDTSDESLKVAVAYYKVASDWFREKLLDSNRKFRSDFNRRD